MNWQTFISTTPKLVGKIATEDIQNLLDALRANADASVKEQADKMETYLNDLATGAMSKSDFAIVVESSKRVLESQALTMEIQTRAATQQLASDVEQVLIQGLVALLP
jgi:ppGpp synthetase/RelA/SpoT-type nucleotidyltranferase